MNGHSRLALAGKASALLAAAIAMIPAPGWTAHPTAAGRYRALESLPDFSGWWVALDFYPNAPKIEVADRFNWFVPPPLKPEGLMTYQQVVDAMIHNRDLSQWGFKPSAFCRPYRFNGLTFINLEGEMEFLFTPGRVTFTDEFGHLRRIYTDGRSLPADPEESYTGTSVGHWENGTLIVDTIGISHEASWAGDWASLPVGPGARSHERISLREPDILQIETVVTAPASLTRPFRSVILLHRDRDHVLREFRYCTDYDRDVDETGRQRFDLTPPADLPPPPSS